MSASYVCCNLLIAYSLSQFELELVYFHVGRSPSMGASGAGSDRWAIFSPTCGTGGFKPRARCTRSAP